MKIIPAAVLVLLMGSGCFHLSPEQKRAISAPLGVATEISMAAPSFYLRHNRWPKTKEDMLEGLRGMNQKPEFALDIRTLTVVEESERSILYYCTFPDGGSTEIRVNLKIETEPNRVPVTD